MVSNQLPPCPCASEIIIIYGHYGLEQLSLGEAADSVKPTS